MPALFERCQHCGTNIMAGSPKHYGEQQVARQSHTSPAEYIETGPYCDKCWLYSLPEADARDEERRSLKGYSDSELERI